MFDITGSDIASLTDTDLRTLIARLCEAELLRKGFSKSGVTAGGDQNAPDGGLDVRVELSPDCELSGYIPRSLTGFQVKVPDMPRAEILKEMRPGGVLRRVIAELANRAGAYIIVSAKSSTADSALQARRKAMIEACEDINNAASLAVDFYDRERVASWVRGYPGLAAWVREKLGKPLQGWQPYGNWSSRVETDYLRDAKCRLYDESSSKKEALTVDEGIKRLREVLSRPAGIARLIGLSGTGKTRLAQALFDESIGETFLDRSIAIYTDMANEPHPSPRDLIQQLVTSNQRAVVVVDNCHPTTHRALALACLTPVSNVSIMTIEYDVSDDTPEGTDVFRLEPASDDLIEELIRLRHPQVTSVDRDRIAEFSSGNSRVALALSQTIHRGDSVADLSDKDLFERLFFQRRPEDENLLKSAEACSLVYSFDAETLEGDEAELPLLATLANASVEELYRHIYELKQRDLLQQRSRWRAVLPHALANKLARQALESLLPTRITSTITLQPSQRLLLSFSRRLGFLHDSPAAQKIVNGWLSDGELLGDLSRLSPLGIQIFRNVAPVLPAAALRCLDRSLNGDAANIVTDLKHPERYTLASLLRSLAYDRESFDVASGLLAQFVAAEPPGHNHNSTSSLFRELFHIFLSGTQALPSQRVAVIRSLLSAQTVAMQNSGLMAFNAMLTSGHFSSSHNFEFGARSRDFGWEPRRRADIVEWYSEAIDCGAEFAQRQDHVASQVRSILASNFRGLWLNARVHEQLEGAVSKFSARGPWIEGWISSKATLRFGESDLSADDRNRLEEIERTLRPTQLVELARAYALSKTWSALDIADTEDDDPTDSTKPYRSAEARTESLGRELATDFDLLARILPDLVSGQDAGRRFSFGRGLASGAESLSTTWAFLTDAFAAAADADRNSAVIRGFLNAAAEDHSDEVSDLLERAATDEILEPWLPMWEASVHIDHRGVNRLLNSVARGKVPAWRYRQLTIGRAADAIPTQDLSALIRAVATLPDGYDTAVDVLSVKFFDRRAENGTCIDRELIDCGRHLLSHVTKTSTDRRVSYELGVIAEGCLSGPSGEDCCRTVCNNLALALLDYSASVHDFPDLLKALFRAHPMIALDAFLDSDRSRLMRSRYVRPFDEVPHETLVAWAAHKPEERYEYLASVISLFVGQDKADEAIAPAALDLLERAPNRNAVLSRYEERLFPMSWSGSRADILDRRRGCVRPLMEHSDPTIANWAKHADRLLAEVAEKERLRDRRVDERFE